MEIRSLSPLPTASLLYRPREGRYALAVICKITYRLEPDRLVLAEEQEPISLSEAHWEGDRNKSLERPTDLVPFKPEVDVVLVGRVFAPEKKPVRMLIARLEIGEIDKSIAIFGPRTIRRDGSLHEESRFTEMTLHYERARGGPGTWNPVGIAEGASAARGLRPLPQMVPLSCAGDDWDPRMPIEPIGFGPIASSWPIRRDKLGARAATFSDEDLSQTPLGLDFDASYFQVSPPDQRLEALLPDAELALKNLHPAHSRLVTRFPGLLPRAFVEVGQASATPLSLRADTLWVDTDRSLCTVTYRGQVAIAKPDQAGTVYVTLDEPGQPVSWSKIRPMIRQAPLESGAISDSWLGVMPISPGGGFGQSSPKPPVRPSFDFDSTSDSHPEDSHPEDSHPEDDEGPTQRMSIRKLLDD